MRLPFLRAPRRDEPLILAMTGARLGERIVYCGRSAARLIPLAARAGLSGRVVLLGAGDTAATLGQAAHREGVLVEAVEQLPPDGAGGFDLAVLDVPHGGGGAGGRRSAIDQLVAALRPGGRLVAIEPGTRRGLGARFLGGAPLPETDLVPLLETAGLRRPRVVGDQEGLRFVEALRAAQPEG